MDPLAVVGGLLVENAGGFLRNVRRIPSITCRFCGGIPREGYDLCYPCRDWQRRSGPSDRLGLVTYARHGHQTGRVMYGYKADRPSDAAVRVVALMLAWSLRRHAHCMTDSAGPPTHWAVVPSLRRSDRPHPLRELAGPLLDHLPEVPITAAAHPTDPRGLVPTNFVVRPGTYRHVLLLDDTWASGGHVQSAAAALKMTGTLSVTTLVLARWLEVKWARTADFVASHLQTDFTLDVCPFTSTPCP